METCAAIIQNGLVENIIVVDPDDAATIAHFKAIVLPQGSPVLVSWNYDGANFTAPPKYASLAEAQTAQAALMDSAYAAASGAPIAYMGTTFQADEASQALVAAVLTASGGMLPAGFTWYDVNNVAQPMTFAALQGLAGSILMRGQPLFVHKQTQKAAIRAASSVAQVQAVTW